MIWVLVAAQLQGDRQGAGVQVVPVLHAAVQRVPLGPVGDAWMRGEAARLCGAGGGGRGRCSGYSWQPSFNVIDRARRTQGVSSGG